MDIQFLLRSRGLGFKARRGQNIFFQAIFPIAEAIPLALKAMWLRCHVCHKCQDTISVLMLPPSQYYQFQTTANFSADYGSIQIASFDVYQLNIW